MTHVRVNGFDLEYVDVGSGVPVLFSHGGHSDLRYWPATGDYSSEAHTADLVAIMRRLDAGPVHLIGFSEGDPRGKALVAWWRAENERVRVDAGSDAAREAKLWFELVNNRGPKTFDAQPEALRRMWLDNFPASRPAAPPQEPLTCQQLGAITTPTLVLGAEYGMPYSRRIVERLAACVPGSRLVVVPSVTHFMSYQEPDVFNRIVLEFLAQH